MLALLLVFCGCTVLEPEPIATPEESVPDPIPQPVPPPPPIVEKDPVPPTPDPEISFPSVFEPLVAVVLSSDQPAYADVASELDKVLENYTLYNLGSKTDSVRDIYQRIAAEEATAVVAIGLRAATTARSFASVPIVFCQVFNFDEHDLISDKSKGVSSLPPLDLQLEAWKEIDPTLQSVGAILGSGHERLIEETQNAASALGIDSQIRAAGSDKETMYVFNRMAQSIDGFLLFPDNRVLSRSVLKDMLDVSARRGIQVAVFNESLLGMGATLSVSTVESDIASTIVRVLDRFEHQDAASLSPITPLTRIRVRTNPYVTRKLGLELAETVANEVDSL
jgi:ABC-type uncharacterized transport system substrate-binding protein